MEKETKEEISKVQYVKNYAETGYHGRDVKVLAKPDWPYHGGVLYFMDDEWHFGNKQGERFVANEEFVIKSITNALKHHRYDLASFFEQCDIPYSSGN